MENHEFNWYDNQTYTEPTSPASDNHQEINHQPEYPQPTPTENPLTQEHSPTFDESQLNDTDIKSKLNKYSYYLGSISKCDISSDSWVLNHNNEKALFEYNSLSSIYNDSQNLCEYKPTQDSELGKILSHISYLGKTKGLQLDKYWIMKCNSNESIQEFFKIESKASFIYTLNSEFNSNVLNIDFSSIGGPKQSFIPLQPGYLTIYPSWVPLSLPTNSTETQLLTLFGTFR